MLYECIIIPSAVLALGHKKTLKASGTADANGTCQERKLGIPWLQSFMIPCLLANKTGGMHRGM